MMSVAGAQTETKKSYRIRREEYRTYPNGYYHLCTDGWKEGKLFNTVQEFAWGMTTMALVASKYNVTIYVFELMDNHLHILLSALGSVCLEVFDFILERVRRRLKEDGYAVPPDDYGFVLVPVKNQEMMCKQALYLIRNPYERGYCMPGGYPWGSDYLIFNPAGQAIRGQRVDSLSVRQMRAVLGSKEVLPPDWEVHPELGVLPRSFVKYQKIEQLFGSVKRYATRLVKDYESFAFAAKSLDEDLVLTDGEIKDMVSGEVAGMYPGRMLAELSPEEKYRLAACVNQKYGFGADRLSSALGLSERVARQVLSSKDFGIRPPRKGR